MGPRICTREENTYRSILIHTNPYSFLGSCLKTGGWDENRDGNEEGWRRDRANDDDDDGLEIMIYRMVQNNSCIFEFSWPLLSTNLGIPMNSHQPWWNIPVRTKQGTYWVKLCLKSNFALVLALYRCANDIPKVVPYRDTGSVEPGSRPFYGSVSGSQSQFLGIDHA